MHPCPRSGAGRMRVFNLDRTMFGGVSLVDNKARRRGYHLPSVPKQHAHQRDHVSLRKRDETGEPPVGASPIQRSPMDAETGPECPKGGGDGDNGPKGKYPETGIVACLEPGLGLPCCGTQRWAPWRANATHRAEQYIIGTHHRTSRPSGEPGVLQGQQGTAQANMGAKSQLLQSLFPLLKTLLHPPRIRPGYSFTSRSRSVVDTVPAVLPGNARITFQICIPRCLFEKRSARPWGEGSPPLPF